MIDDVVNALAPLRRARYFNEDDLQEAALNALADAGLDAEREVRLTAADRIDLRCGRIGIEVKVDGAAATVQRQLARYARTGQLDAVVLLTSRAKHRMPAELDGVPVHVVSLITGGL